MDFVLERRGHKSESDRGAKERKHKGGSALDWRERTKTAVLQETPTAICEKGPSGPQISFIELMNIK